MTVVDWLLDSVALVLGLLHLFVVRNFLYWKDKGVPHLPPLPLVGSLLSLVSIKDSPAVFLQRIHQAAGAHPCFGFFIFGRPALLVREPGLLQNILIKDFANFRDRLTSSDRHKDPVGAGNLFCLKGEKWRHIRANLTPTFSTFRLKIMFRSVLHSAEQTRDYVQQQEGKPVNVKDLFTKTTVDSVCSTLFGIESNTLHNPESEFRHYGKKILQWTPYRALEIFAHFFCPALLRVLDAKLFQRESTQFLTRAFSESIAAREASSFCGHDLLDTLVTLKNQDDEVLGQALLFFVAGSETTSTTISFAMYELAVQVDIQRRLRNEIKDILAQHGDRVTYEAVQDMVYLDMVVSEVLRKYPIMAFIDRVTLCDYYVPGMDVMIESGTPVFVSLLGLHRDPEFHTNPLQFDPERFSKDRKSDMNHLSYIPFGTGPRSCVGLRLALLSVKLVLVVLLQRYWVAMNEKTPVPLVLSPYVLFLKNVGQLPLVFVPNEDVPA